MATKSLTIRDRGRSEDTGTLVENRRYMGFSDEARGRDWAMLGSKVKVFGRITDVGVSADQGNVRRKLRLDITDEAPSVDIATVATVLRRTVQLQLIDTTPSGDVATFRLKPALRMLDIAESRDVGDMTATLPVLRQPLPGEAVGTVNLVRNPNLQYDSVGIRDWLPDPEITLTRTTAATPWVGTVSGQAAITPGAGTPQLLIRSQRGLHQTGAGKTWVGSIELRGDAIPVASIRLRLVYEDGSIQEETAITISDKPGDQVGVDPITGDPLFGPSLPGISDTWRRFSTHVVTQDPVKPLDFMAIAVIVPRDPTVERILRLQAAQIESAAGGGATMYADGDQGPGHSWVYAPGMSMSVRETGA